MGYVVDYVMKMQDLMSGPLGRIANAYDNVSNHAKKAGESSSLFSKLAMGSFGLNNILGAASTAISVASKIGSAIGNTMQAALDRQQLQVSFDVLTGSKAAGGKLTKELVDLQQNTILGTEVFKNAQTMLGFGFKDTEVVDNLRMLGDVSMGDAEKLNSLTLAFSQIRSAGKLQGQDLLQLINAGFNPLEEMSKRTGKSIGTLKDEMSQGNITFEMVQQAFHDATGEGGKFNNMLGTIAKTDAGMKAQLGGAFEELKIKVGNAFSPLTHFGLELATKLLPVMENMVNPLAEGVRKAVSWLEAMQTKVPQLKAYFAQMLQPAMSLIQRIRESLGGLSDYLTPVAELFEQRIYPLAVQLWTGITGIVGDLTKFVSSSELLKDIFAFIGHIIGGIGDMLRGLVSAVQWLWNNVIMPLLNGIEKAYRWIKGSDMQGGSNKPIDAVTGTAVPVVTENAGTNRKLQQIADNTKRNADAGTTTAKAVASSGPKVVNINVQKFFDNIQFTTNNLQESTARIEETVLEVLSRVLVQGAATV